MRELTAKQLEVLRLATQGLANKEIARATHRSERSVRRDLQLTYRTLGLRVGNKRLQAAQWYLSKMPLPPKPRVIPPWFPSEHQQEILAQTWYGLGAEEIGAKLGLAKSTIKNTLTIVYRKLGVADQTVAAVWLWELCRRLEHGPCPEAADRRPHPADDEEQSLRRWF